MRTRLWLAGVALVGLGLQLAALEVFDRFYYRVEDWYSARHRSAGEHAAEYVLDELGFRNTGIDYADKRQARVLFVGSFSMGFGTGVRGDQTFPSVFQARLRELRPETPVEVINANLGNLDLPATFERLGATRLRTLVRPDVVVYGLYEAMPGQYERRRGTALEERVFGNGQEASRFRGTARSDITRNFNGMLIRSKLPHGDPWYWVYSHSYLGARLLAYVDLTTANTLDAVVRRGRGEEQPTRDFGYLADLTEYLRTIGVRLVVVRLPRRSTTDAVTADLAAALDALSRLGVPSLDIEEALPGYPFNWVADGHYGVESNAILGRTIAEWFNQGLDARGGLAQRERQRPGSARPPSLLPGLADAAATGSPPR